MEKIIKYYEDGAIKNYQNSITIYTSTIEEARTIVELFKKKYLTNDFILIIYKKKGASI